MLKRRCHCGKCYVCGLYDTHPGYRKLLGRKPRPVRPADKPRLTLAQLAASKRH